MPSIDIVKRLAESLRVSVDELIGPRRTEPKAAVRKAEARLLATVRDLDDAAIDDITKGVRLIMAAVRRSM